TPHAEQMLALYQEVSPTIAFSGATDNEMDDLVASFHARMVFHPTEAEKNWMVTAEHTEGFGVFHTSRFGDRNGKSLASKVLYSANVVRSRKLPHSHWPWLDLDQSALPG